MERLGRWIVRYRLPILGVTLAVVAAGAVLVPGLRIDISSRNLVFVDDKVRAAFQRYLEEWGSDRYTTIGVKFKDGDAFTHERLTFLRDLTERLGKVDMVDKVDSIATTTVMSARGDTLFVGALVPKEIPTDPAALDAIRRRTLSSPLLRRMFVDERGAMVGINLRMRDSGDDERKIMLAAKEVKRLLWSVKKPPGVELYRMGGPPMLAEMYDLVRRDLWVLGVAPVVLVGIFLLIAFRSARGMLFPLATVISTGIVTFGGMVATGHQVNMVTTMLPCLMMVISVSNVIHVLVQQREAVAGGADRDQSVIEAVRRVGLPCLMTSLTTAVGFASLLLSDVPQVREFGLFAAVGVTVAMLLGVISVPAALAILPRPDPVAARQAAEGFLTRVLDRLAGWGHRKLPVLGVALVAAVLGGLGLLRLEAESSTREYLPKNHPLRMEFEMVESNLMGGVPIILHVQDDTPHAAAGAEPAAAGAEPDPAEVRGASGRLPAARPVAPPTGAPDASGLAGREDDEVIDDPDEAAGREASPGGRGAGRGRGEAPLRSVGRESLKRPELLAVLDEITQGALGLPFVRKVISVTEYLKEVNRVMHGGGREHYRLPMDRRVIAAYLEMAAGQDRDGLAKLMSFEYSKANITIMMAWPNTRNIRQLIQKMRAHLERPDVKARLGDGIKVEVTGMAPMLSHVADRIVDGQIKSFFSALAIICLMMIGVLWSFRVGLLAMVPNVLPIVVTLGLMGWVGITLNVTTVMIASIALGIAVDDTIHVLFRMRVETRAAGGDHEVGARRAIHSVGRAVVFTSLVLSGGFAILLLASLVPAAHFGILVSFTMLTALLADLVLTPALIFALRPWRGPKGPGGVSPPPAPPGSPDP